MRSVQRRYRRATRHSRRGIEYRGTREGLARQTELIAIAEWKHVPALVKNQLRCNGLRDSHSIAVNNALLKEQAKRIERGLGSRSTSNGSSGTSEASEEQGESGHRSLSQRLESCVISP